MKMATMMSALLGCASLFGSDEAVSREVRQVWDGNACAAIPLLSAREAPVIDGNFSEKEWEKSVKLAGFIQPPGDRGLVKGKSGFVYIAADRKNIYIAVRTTTPNFDPGGGLVTLAKEHDGNVWADDAVEVLINPDTEKNKTYHLILNSAGVLFDRLITYNPSQKEDVSWDIKGLKRASAAGSGWWTLEMKIPRSEVGSPAGGVGINVARNWSGLGQSALIPTASHADRKRMIELTWDPQDIPALKMDELGAPDEGDWDVKISAVNVPSGEEYLLAAELICRHYPAGKPAYFSRDALKHEILKKDGSIHFKAEAETTEIHTLFVMLKDLADGKILFRRTFNARKGVSAGLIPATASFELPGAGGVLVYNYPGCNKTELDFKLKSALDVAGVTVTTKLPNGKVKSAPAQYAARRWKASVPCGPEEGDYVHGVEIKLKNGKTMKFAGVTTMTKRRFAWENNTLGKDEIIVPPFTPITAKGNEFGVIYRTHKVNASGLWDSVVAKGRELLAAPMYYELTVDGRKERFLGRAHPVHNRKDGYAAQVSNRAESSSGVALHTDSAIDYDGFFYNRVKILNPGGATIDRLTLVVPLKETEARLMHGVADTIRSNPTGNIPSGKGVVWTGDKAPHNVMYGKQVLHPQFLPYFWLGTEERGLSWLMTSSYGSRLAKDIPAFRVVRKKGVVQLEIDLINVPTKTQAGDGFAFGLMATPVKPVDRELLRYLGDATGGRIPGIKREASVYSPLAGQPGFFREPYEQDYKLMEAVSRMLSTGKHVEEFDAALKQWNRKHLAGITRLFKNYASPDNDGKKYITWWKRVRNTFNRHHHVAAGNGESLPTIYSDPRLIAAIEPTGKYFLSEWCFGSLGYTYTYRSYPTPTNLDYMVYCYDQQLKHGIPGVYLDDMWICPDFNTDTVAKVDRYGQTHAETGLLQLRELVRRIAVLQYKHHCRPRWLEIHMTNALLIPCFSFATIQLGWEDKYGESEFQERFREDAIRAINLGVKIGAVSRALDGIYRQTTPQEKWNSGLFKHLNRTMMASILPHNIRPLQRLNRPNDGIDWDLVTKIYSVYGKFEPWSEDCRFVPYYEEDGGLSGVPAGVLASSYRRPGKTLIVLGNQGKAQKFRLKLDRSKLGVPGDAVLTDVESGNVIADGKINLPRRDFKALWLGPAKK